MRQSIRQGISESLIILDRVWQDGYGGRNRKSSIFNLGSDSSSDSDVGAPGIGSVGLSGSVLDDM
ncbi:hypothetical protein WUBG_02996 [Wuchereria bancrofti]|uniref:Uncharacterized protein n=1 Tax=Wuchereria bancrofti TaxID=6293 RepID=J9F994_WUCBA|nr:hypothetical protein WUBG_02996 [Wuchereria bancrofti]VDM21337.1 unnamed protein product [Wuchereria bancrofti]